MPSQVWRTKPEYIRGNAEATAFDYDSAKNLPHYDREYTEEEMWRT